MSRTPSLTLPGFFHWLPLLPFGLPIAARLGAAENGWTAWLQPDLWFLIAASLFAGGVLILLCWGWSAGFRIRFLLGVQTLAYAALIAVWVWSAWGRPLAASAWVPFSPADPRFQIDLPGQPSQEMEASNGWPQNLCVYRVERKWEETTWSLAFAELDWRDERVPQATFYRQFRDGLLAANPDSSLIRNQAAEVGDYIGWEVSLLRVEGGILRTRIAVMDRRVYVLTVSGPTVSLDRPEIERFFRSFRIRRQQPVEDPPSPERLPGLVAYLPFEEGQGTSTANRTGGQALLEGAEWTAGVRGKGVRLTGSGCVVLKLPDFRVPAGAPFTLAGWVRAGLQFGFVVFAGDPDSGQLLSLGVHAKDLAAHASCNLARKEKPARRWGELILTSPVDYQWHHFALCRDHRGKLEAFFDGASRGRLTGWQVAGEMPFQEIILGGLPPDLAKRRRWFTQENERQLNLHLVGELDEFCIFRRALWPQEIEFLAGRRAAEQLPPVPVDADCGPSPPPPLPAFPGPISQLAFSPDGRTLATTGPGQPIILWQTASGKEIGRLPNSSLVRPTHLTFSAEGQMLACAGDGALHLWDPASRQPYPGRIRGAVFALSSDAKTVAVADAIGAEVRLLERASGQQRGILNYPDQNQITGLTFAHADRRLVITLRGANESHIARIVDLEKHDVWEEIQGSAKEERPPSLGVSPDGNVLVGGSLQSWRLYYHLLLDPPRAGLFGPRGRHYPDEPPLAAALAPDRTLGATYHRDGTVLVWQPLVRDDTPSEAIEAVFPGWLGPVPLPDDGALAFIPGGRLLAVIRQGKLEYLSVEHIAAPPWPPLDRQRLGLPAENR